MKKELIIGISLLAMIIAGTIYLASGPYNTTLGVKKDTIEQVSTVPTTEPNNVAGRSSHNLVINGSMPNPVGKILIYKTIPPSVNKESTLALAKKFNVTGKMVGDQGVQSDDLRFISWSNKKSGAIRYQDQNRPNANMDAPEYLPSDDEAIKIATKFLKDRDLYPEGAVTTPPRHEYAYSSKGTITFGQICIWYHRMLNGLKVEGTQLVVYVGGNGDVIGYFANWRNYEPYKEYPIVSPDEAFNRLKAKGVAVGMNQPDSTVSIADAYLAYLTEAAAYKEDYLEPVWVFKGNVLIDGKSVMPVEEFIPALTDESVKSLSS